MQSVYLSGVTDERHKYRCTFLNSELWVRLIHKNSR